MSSWAYNKDVKQNRKVTIGLLSHYFQHENLGCVALAISNVSIIDKIAQKLGVNVHYKVLITNNNPQPILEFTKNSYEYCIFPRCKQSIRNPLKLLRTKVFNDCNFVFNICAGDGFTDLYGFGRVLAETYMTILGKIKKTKMVLAPQTIGPFNKMVSRVVAKKAMASCEAIFSRDEMSTQCCIDMGFGDRTIEVIDVAFALPYQTIRHDGDRFKVGINVSGLLYNGGYDRDNYFGLSFSYADFIDQLLQKLLNMDVEIHLVAHVTPDDNLIEDDYATCQKLAQKDGAIILAPRFSSPIDAKSYIAGLDLFSGARMHSTIGAFSSGVPVIPIAYSRKFNGLFNTLQYPYYIDAKTGYSVDSAIEKFMAYMVKIEDMRQALALGKQIYIDRLQKYESYICRLLDGVSK